MKKVILSISLLFLCSIGIAQTDSTYRHPFSIDPDTLFEYNNQYISGEFIDLDRNGSIELVNYYARENQQYLIRYDLNFGVTVDTIQLPKLENAQVVFENYDSKGNDELIYHNSQTIYVLAIDWNEHKLEKIDSLQGNIEISNLTVADLDLNTQKELIFSGTHQSEPGLYSAQRQNGIWDIQKLGDLPDFFNIHRWVNDPYPKVFSFLNDSLKVLSNSLDTVALDTAIYLPGKIISSEFGNLDNSDTLDLIISVTGVTEGTYVMFDNSFEFLQIDSSTAEKIFIGDVNGDQLQETIIQSSTDINYFQNTNSVLSSEVMLGGSDLIPGDYDYDGDLDFVHVIDGNILRYQNESNNNEAPGFPTGLLAFPFGDQIRIQWDPSSDDHSNQISYDLNIWKEGEDSEPIITGAIDSAYSRTKVTEGNFGYLEYAELNQLSVGSYVYFVAPIDDAYFGSSKPGHGEPARFIICENQVYTQISRCEGTLEEFSVGDSLHWYSEQFGYLGETDTLHYEFQTGDRLVASSGNATECSDYYSWELFILEENKLNVVETICLGDSTFINYETNQLPFDSLNWISSNGYSDTTQLITIPVQSDFSILVNRYVAGCSVTDTFAIVSSKPFPQISPTSATITATESVTVTYDPTYSYTWNPNTGVQVIEAGIVELSPMQTTIYFVNVEDSAGCAVQEIVEITVGQTAYLPELFTPNGDGRNDRFRILGLTRARQFQFQIKDKRGNQVYETNSILDLSGIGWNGDHNGQPVPTGTYFWSVRGVDEQGETILINGMDAGIVNLLR